MTRRINASRFYHGRHERRRDPLALVPGDVAARVLESMSPLAPALATYPEFRCRSCGTLIEPGETAWTSSLTQLPYPTICYHCGLSWELAHNRLSDVEAASIPAYGGPATSYLTPRESRGAK